MTIRDVAELLINAVIGGILVWVICMAFLNIPIF